MEQTFNLSAYKPRSAFFVSRTTNKKKCEKEKENYELRKCYEKQH
jgi:hypothetical protein